MHSAEFIMLITYCKDECNEGLLTLLFISGRWKLQYCSRADQEAGDDRTVGPSVRQQYDYLLF